MNTDELTNEEWELLKKRIIEVHIDFVENSMAQKVEEEMDRRNFRYELRKINNEICPNIVLNYKWEFSKEWLQYELRCIRKKMEKRNELG